MTSATLDDRDPNTMFGGWLQIRRGVYACVPAKCGSQSLKLAAFGVNRLKQVLELRKRGIRQGMIDIGPFTPWEVAKFQGTKILGVREPVDRFGALWRDKCRDSAKTQHRIARVVGGMTPDELVEFIARAPFFDSHWFPQSVYLVPDCSVVPNDMILETLGLEAVRHNRRPPSDEPLPAERVREIYARDVHLYAEACAAVGRSP